MENMIDITGVDLVKFVQKVYELSVPQGLGRSHFTPEPLTKEEAKRLINENAGPYDCVVDMDYIRGRACKMNVWKEGGRFYIRDSWYDHTDEQLYELLNSFSFADKLKTPTEHCVACDCAACRAKRRGAFN